VASSRQLHWEWIEPCWRGSSSTRRLGYPLKAGHRVPSVL
jgi:hypothetical protein